MIIHVAGGSVWDERLIVERLQDGESVPMQSHSQIGGVARNVAYALKQTASDLTLETHFIRGDDAAGEALNSKLQQQGLSGAQAIPNQTTARYLSIENTSGTVLHGLADMAIFDHFPSLNHLVGDALVLDTNVSAGFLDALNVDMPVYLVATSPTKIQRAANYLHKFHGLFLNRQEAVALLGMGKDAPLPELATALAARGPKQILVTHGANAPVVFEDSVCQLADTPPYLPADHSHNGLGDRLTGLSLGTMLNNKTSLKQAVNASLKILGQTDT